jgi:hypothetical protein
MDYLYYHQPDGIHPFKEAWVVTAGNPVDAANLVLELSCRWTTILIMFPQGIYTIVQSCYLLASRPPTNNTERRVVFRTHFPIKLAKSS